MVAALVSCVTFVCAHVELWDDALALCLSSVICGLPSPSYAVAATTPVQEVDLNVLMDLMLRGKHGVYDLRRRSGLYDNLLMSNSTMITCHCRIEP